MPEMDGFEAAKAIRAGECGTYFKDIAIVATSAGLLDMDEQYLKNSGMNDFIAQPLNPNDLRRVLVKWRDWH